MAPDLKYHTSLVTQQWKLLGQLINEKTTQVSVDGKSLDIPRIVYVARYSGNAFIAESSYSALKTSYEALQRSLGAGEVIYGVNTGFGASADTRTSDTGALQRVLSRELSYGILPPGPRDPRPRCLTDAFDLSLEEPAESHHLPLTWVRAAILIRINSLIKGYSGIRPVIVETMQALLAHNIIPMIPLRGSISASGDLSPLAYVCSVLQAKPTARVLPISTKKGPDVYANEAMAKAGIPPVFLQAKEGLAIVNGTSISAAVGALVLHDAHQLALLSQILTAMCVEALQGSPESFHPFFAESRPHPGQIESSRNISAFLQGSKLAQTNDGTDGSLRQDRYSVRTAAQWIGPALEDLVLAHQQISIECNSATDNPLVDREGNFLHGGNFQAKSVTAAMEKTRQAAQTIGRMIFTQCQEMINPATARGLLSNLVAEDPSKSAIFKAIDIYISALLPELGFLAGPVNHVQNAELGNQSLNSLALISARYTATSIGVLTQLTAAHLLALCQALDLRAIMAQFLDTFRNQFSSLVKTLFKDSSEPQAAEELEPVLWTHLIKTLDASVTMDAKDRFIHAAKSMRLPVLESSAFKALTDPLTRLQTFVDNLSSALNDLWVINLDVYIAHGTATPLLGTASKKVYTFVRQTLGVPFLCTARILTPLAEEFTFDFDSEQGDPSSAAGKEAPTVGSYVGVVYRAIRKGVLMPVIAELLEEAIGEQALGK